MTTKPGQNICFRTKVGTLLDRWLSLEDRIDDVHFAEHVVDSSP